MLKTSCKNGKAGSITTGMAVSILVSSTTTLIFSAIIAILLDSEKISWTQAGYWIMAMLFFAAFLAGKCAYQIVKRQRFLIAVMSGILYWTVLLCTTCLFFGGNLEAVPETAGIIMTGSFIQLLLSTNNTTTQRRMTSNQFVKLTKKRH